MNKIIRTPQKKCLLTDQKGAVSMLSVTIFAIIITVVATSYIKTVISQQKNALDYDKGTRAYYAAEVGVQDGVRAIQADPTIRRDGKTDCKPFDSPASGKVVLKSDEYGLAYTCQIIDVTPGEIRGSVTPGQKSVVVRIEPKDVNFSSNFQLVFRWSSQNADEILYPRNSTLPEFPSINKWGTVDKPIHALLRTQFISYPKPSFSNTAIKQRVMFLNPTEVTAAGPSPVISLADSVGTEQNKLFVSSACEAGDSGLAGPDMKGFLCKRSVRFSGYTLNNTAFYINIGSVYRSTDFSIEMIEDTSPYPIVPLANTQATIDVTATSGDTTFRRVRQTLPLGGYAEQDGPNAALVVGEGVCKNFAIGATAAQYYSDCTP